MEKEMILSQENIVSEHPVVITVLNTRLDEFLARARRAAETFDVEDVHKTRTASRRLRTALRLTRTLFSDKQYRKVLKPLRKMAKAAGGLRDRDVEAELLDKYQDHLPEELKSAALQFAELIREGRGEHVEELARLFNAETIDKIEERLKKILSKKKVLQRADEETWKENFNTVLQDYLEVLEKGINRLHQQAEAQLDEELYHEVRIEAKRVRYSLELMEDLFAAETGELVKRVREIQQEFGLTRDLARLIERLGCAYSAEGPVSEGDWIGLIEFFHRERETSRHNSLAHLDEFLNERILPRLLESLFQIDSAANDAP